MGFGKGKYKGYFVLSASLILVFGILSSPNFFQQFDVYAGVPINSEAPLISYMWENIPVSPQAETNSGSGFIGQLFETENCCYPDLKITKIIGNFEISGLTNGILEAVVLSNVFEGDFQGSEVVETVSDSVNLSSFPTISSFNAPFNENIVFTFSNPPLIDFSNEDVLIGYRWTGFVDGGSGVFNTEGNENGDDNGEGICLKTAIAESDTWEACDDIADLGIEIVVQVDDVDDLITTGGIVPTKLVLHHSFDSVYTAVYDEQFFVNSGTFGHNGDWARLGDNYHSQDDTAIVVGKIGNGAQIDVPASGHIGLSSRDSVNQWNFLSDDGDDYSISMWIKATWTDQPSSMQTPLLTNQGSEGKNLFGIGVNEDQKIELEISSGDGETIFNQEETNDVLSDDTWELITVIVEKSNVTSTATVCINTSCTNLDRSQSFQPQVDYPDRPLVMGDSNAVFTNIGTVTEPINFEVDELCIWKNYKLTSSDRAALYNSGNGSVCGTVEVAAGVSDTDGDGIDDEIDILPIIFSDGFADLLIGGTSDGIIVDRGDQVLTVTEENNPDGVRVKADISGGVAFPATVEFCTAMSSIDFDPGDEAVVTCSSVSVTAISGSLAITFFATDDTEAIVTLTQGNSITFFQDTFSFTTPSTNTETLIISVSGEDTSIEPGTTVVIPLNQDPICTSAIPSQDSVWPPNHKFNDIVINGITDPDGHQVTISIDGITQDEPTPGPGKKHSPDGDGVGTDTAIVRAERDDSGDGRVYEITFTADDGRDGTCTSSVKVGVPHDQSGDPAVDSGQNYDSTQ